MAKPKLKMTASHISGWVGKTISGRRSNHKIVAQPLKREVQKLARQIADEPVPNITNRFNQKVTQIAAGYLATDIVAKEPKGQWLPQPKPEKHKLAFQDGE